MDYKAQALEFFKGDIYAMETTGIEIDEVDVNTAKCHLNIDGRHLNAADCVMGGAIFTLADFTMAVAANAGRPQTVSLNMNINYLCPAKGPTLFAEATCVKDGRSVCFYQVNVTDSQGKTVATATGSGFRKQG